MGFDIQQQAKWTGMCIDFYPIPALLHQNRMPPDPITDLLRHSKTIAIVGLSANPMRPSHEVASYLQRVGYQIIPVNPNESEILGQKSYPRLEDIPLPIDIVDVFRRPEYVPAIADSAIVIHAKCLWLQQGLTHAAAAAKARAAGLFVIEDACLFVEHRNRRPF
jgi:predicted CoA-binding protein